MQYPIVHLWTFWFSFITLLDHLGFSIYLHFFKVTFIRDIKLLYPRKLPAYTF